MKIVFVTGQTATGKTKLAQELAHRFNGELVNFDSRQIYKYLDIITGKDIANNKIHLYDLVDPREYFSSFDYVKYAIPVVKKIIAAGKTPVFVGGTYLYLKHLLYNIDTENIKPNWGLRRKLGNKTVNELQNILHKISAKLMSGLNQSDRNNPQRLIRKIELAKSTSINRLINLKFSNKIILDNRLGIDHLKINLIGLKFKQKQKLVNSIKKRVEERLKQGAVTEVKSLLKKGYNENAPGLKTIGYQQIIKFLKGELTKKQAVEQWINKEIQYAKRQYTFMKRDPNIIWREI